MTEHCGYLRPRVTLLSRHIHYFVFRAIAIPVSLVGIAALLLRRGARVNLSSMPILAVVVAVSVTVEASEERGRHRSLVAHRPMRPLLQRIEAPALLHLRRRRHGEVSLEISHQLRHGKRDSPRLSYLSEFEFKSVHQQALEPLVDRTACAVPKKQ